MNPSRRALLCGATGGAVLWMAAAPLRAQVADKARILPTPPVLRPPRLVVTGAAVPVQLRSVALRAELSGRMALTTVELEFFNPNPRVLEGELQFPLLEGQAVVGMAMDVDGTLREAVPVDKAHGEAVFEDVTRARIDPALLSATEGNNHKLRVYPIPGNGSKRVLIRYAETLALRNGRLGYRLPLEFGERLAELAVAIRVTGADAPPRASAGALTVPAFVASGNGHALDWTQRDTSPRGVLDIDIAAARAGSVSTGERQGRAYFVAQLAVPQQRQPRSLPRVLQIVWDNSGSGAERDHGREFALLDACFAAAREVEVRLQRVSHAAEPVQVFKLRGGDWSALRRSLEDTVYDGATDLGAIVPDKAAAELWLFSDGLSNFGAQRLAAPRVPVFAISAAVRTDSTRLRGLAKASGGAFIDLLASTPEDARTLLLERSTRLLRMESNGARRLVAASTRPDEGWLTVAGELAERQTRVKLTLEHPDGRQQVVDLPIEAQGSEGTLAPQTWARLQISALEADEALNRAEIRRVSRDFGIVTRETSLIILDRAEDYARHDITPPPELAKTVDALRSQARLTQQRSTQAHLDQVARLFEQKIAWWERDFPKDQWRTKDASKAELPASPAGALEASRLQRNDMAAGRAMAAPAAPAPAMTLAPAMAKSRGESDAQRGAQAVIRLRAPTLDAPYLRRLSATPTAQLYRVYLDERPGQANSTAFFLDVAELLYERGLPDQALRVLSNLAEMDLENRQVLRILAQRLLQAGQPRLAVPLLRKVLLLAPHEPQSHRDLGLALAADGQPQAAVDQLREVLLRPWPRFPEVELIALAELNAIVATQGKGGLDTSRIDPRLLRNLPLDLRAVLTWDTDNTDVDLWVTDPNGEAAYYGNALTFQGGRMSHDATGGYGPEEFSLKRAKPGVYRVEAKFFGQRQQIVSAYTTIQLVLSTHFGTTRQQDKRVTLRLREPKERVFVGEFEIR